MRVNIAILPILALACAAAGCEQTPVVPGGVAEEPIGTLVASIDVQPGHVIRFYEVEPGLIIAAESGQTERQPPLLAQQKIRSYVEVFKTLAPGSAVPPALLAAEARRDALPAQATVPQPPDGRDPSKAEGPSLYTPAEQAWFRQTFCPAGTQKCVDGWGWIDSGWDYTDNWKSTVMVGSEGSVAALHTAYWWKCSGGSCWWEILSSAYVSPGYYDTLSGSSGWFYFKSTLTGAGSGTRVSMAISTGP